MLLAMIEWELFIPSMYLSLIFKQFITFMENLFFQCRSLVKSYSDNLVVNNVTFSIAPGECLGVKQMMDLIAEEFPNVKCGYFNPPIERMKNFDTDFAHH